MISASIIMWTVLAVLLAGAVASVIAFYFFISIFVAHIKPPK